MLRGSSVFCTAETGKTVRQCDKAVDPNYKSRNNWKLVFYSTGSGKTLSYLLPIIHRILDRREKHGPANVSDNSNKPTALIIAPSMELTQQIHAVATDLTSDLDIQVAMTSKLTILSVFYIHNSKQVGILCGRSLNINVRNYLQKLRKNKEPMDILIATPGVLSKAIATRESLKQWRHLISCK